MKTTIFSHRLYKDEFNVEFVHQLERGNIIGLHATDESSENVLVIEGELETLQKLGEIMYVNDPEKIAEVFPGFITKEDSDRRQKELFYQTFDQLRSNLCRIINMTNTTSYQDTKELNLMYEMFCQMNDLMK